MTVPAAPWWQTAFGADYASVYAHRDDAAAVAEVAGISPLLAEVRPGPVLDAGCGTGRHLAALLAAGVDAWGFDASSDLLALAEQRPGLARRVRPGDMRHPPYPPGSFAAVLLFFTAFGYFTDAENGATLHALAALLRPGGGLLLDLPDPDRLRAQLVPVSERTLADGRRLVERRRLTGPRVEKDVELITQDGAVRRWQESVRLYSEAELQELATAAGLRRAALWPSLLGPDRDQQRRVWWLRRDRRGTPSRPE